MGKHQLDTSPLRLAELIASLSLATDPGIAPV